MAEILLGINTLNGSAAVASVARRLSYAQASPASSAQVSANTVRIQNAAGSPIGTATTANDGRLVKYVNSAINGAATATATSYKYKTISASLLGTATVEMYLADRDIKLAMSDYLPRYYQDFAQITAMLNTGANESTRMQAKLIELLDQFYVNSATYALSRWGDIADIEVIPQRSVDSQRHFINAKLRGVGTVTPALLKSIVDAFYTAEIYEEASDFKVRVKLIGKRGVPKNLEDIERAVTDVIPAHLLPYFEFTYLPWSEVMAAGLTWQQADTYTLDGLEKAFLLT